MFKNKRILFFSLQFFGYQHEIKKYLEKEGAKVDFFDERPANNFWVKALIRINRNLLAKYIDHYHNRIISLVKDCKYDYIFFIKGETFASGTIQKLKKIYPNARLIIYHWDSIANNPNAQQLIPFFDKIFSFDKDDCEKLGLHFLPLFYLQDYAQISKTTQEYQYGFFFVGTIHSDRYQLIKSIEKQLRLQGVNSFMYLFFPSKILYYKMKLQNKYLRDTSVRDFHFQSMKKENLLHLYKASKAILDIQHPFQTGLTMRSIETLGAKRKLITTNASIKEYDFYCEQNILVVDREHPVVPDSFLKTPFMEIQDEVYRKYSLGNWLHTIFQ